ECFADGIRWIGEENLTTTLWRDVHACGNHVEASRFQRRDQRAELCQDALDSRHAELTEHQARELWRFARQAAGTRIDIGIRSLVGKADAHHACGPNPLQRIVSHAWRSIELARARPQPR